MAESVMKQGCIISPWYMNAVVKFGVRRIGGGKRVELPYLFYADDLVLYGESEEDLKVMV